MERTPEEVDEDQRRIQEQTENAERERQEQEERVGPAPEPAEGRVGPEDMAPVEGPTDEVQRDDHDAQLRRERGEEDDE